MIGESIHSIQAPICSTIPRWSHFGWLSESSMPPVTRRGYNNEFKHEVKSASMPLQEHRPGVFISTPREGRPPRRPPQCRCRSTAFHLSSLCASARAKALYGALIPRGRDDLRPVRLNTSSRQQLSGLLSPPSGFSPSSAPSASIPAPASNFQVCSLLP